jgi:hypothetical protein
LFVFCVVLVCYCLTVDTCLNTKLVYISTVFGVVLLFALLVVAIYRIRQSRNNLTFVAVKPKQRRYDSDANDPIIFDGSDSEDLDL